VTQPEAALYGGGARPRLLLVGAGHAHLEVLRQFARRPIEACRLTVLSPVDRHVYSGMVPGFLAGQYRFQDASADVGAMVRAARGELVRGRAARFDAAARTVTTDDGRSLDYDLVSFNVGSRTVRGDDPDVRAHAMVLKPFELVRDVRARLETMAARPPSETPRVLVVGAGAAGFEVACAADAVLARGGHGECVTILEGGSRILPGYADRVASLALGALERRHIRVRTGQRVARVEAGAALLAGGERVEADLVLWLVGTTSMGTFEGCGLPLDDRGYLLVDGHLRSVVDRSVFAVGDCATLADHPETPKAGVYAVRETPILVANIVAALRGLPPPARYVPQAGFLSLLNTCDGRAILRWKAVAAHARWCWWLKDRIDRAFMAHFIR